MYRYLIMKLCINYVVFDFYYFGWFLKELGESCWVILVFLFCSLDTFIFFSFCLVKYIIFLVNNINLLN